MSTLLPRLWSVRCRNGTKEVFRRLAANALLSADKNTSFRALRLYCSAARSGTCVLGEFHGAGGGHRSVGRAECYAPGIGGITATTTTRLRWWRCDHGISLPMAVCEQQTKGAKLLATRCSPLAHIALLLGLCNETAACAPCA